MTQAPTPGPLWMMHVIGPDDIYPAPDHATAVEWCAALNASVPKNDVLCVAVPAIWIGTPEAHAEGLSEAVEGWTSPRQRPTAPVEASGSEREADAWKWLGQLYPNDAPSDLAYDANEMVDAFLAGSGRSDRMAKALERIADEQQYRSGYCQTDITVEPALTAEEAQTVAREALAQQTAPRPQPSGETREGSEDRWRDRALSAEASMEAIRRIEDAKAFGALSATDVACYRYPGEDQQALRGAFVDGVMSQSAWSVWLRGPDEVVAAKSYADAVEYCDRLNAEAPLVRAVPMPVGVTLRPAPVASGGQHSGPPLCEDEGCPQHGAPHICTTPARAEAQPYSLYAACQAVLDDYQTSDAHHPDHVLIRRTDFERIKALVEAPVVVQGAWNLVRQAHEILRSGNTPFSAREVNARGKLRDALNPDRARAEAQDEGAAGEREALALDNLANAAEVVRRLLHKTKEVQGPSFREAGISFSTAIDHARAVLRQRDALLAHPSPTPAADADRMR